MKEINLIQFMEELIIELESQQRNGTAHVYKSTLNRLKNFTNGHGISFRQLSPEWLMQFEQKLLADQLKWNTISTYMRMLRSVYNQALERNIAIYIPRLFNKVYTGVDNQTKRAVPPEVICRIMTDKKALPTKLCFYRDIFILLFLFRGMPFVDLAFLRKCDLQGNVITYHRHKTGRKISVVACSEALEIIEKYKNIFPDTPYLLPIIQTPGNNEYQQYSHALRMENYYLLRIAHYLQIKEHLSTYTARHTWATTALKQKYSSNLICDAMGHSSVKVTESYFQSFKEEEIDKMNKSLITFVLSKQNCYI